MNVAQDASQHRARFFQARGLFNAAVIQGGRTEVICCFTDFFCSFPSFLLSFSSLMVVRNGGWVQKQIHDFKLK